jgi:nucleotide-binding universal stress UspA family protein
VLLVPLDGSELAEGALPIATRLATACGASVLLVGVVPAAGQLIAGDGGVVTYVDEDIEQLTSEATEYLARIRDRFPSSVRVESVVRHGSPGLQIADEAEARGAMAVVMATHGRTGLTRSLLGSVAGEVVHRGATPVVLVRSQTASAEAESALASAAASA